VPPRCCESKVPRARSQGARACRLSHRGKVQYRGPTLLVHPGAGASPQRPPSYTLSVLPAPPGTRPQGSPARSTARLLSSPAQGPRPGWAPPTPSTLHALAPSVVESLRLAAPAPRRLPSWVTPTVPVEPPLTAPAGRAAPHRVGHPALGGRTPPSRWRHPPAGTWRVPRARGAHLVVAPPVSTTRAPVRGSWPPPPPPGRLPAPPQVHRKTAVKIRGCPPGLPKWGAAKPRRRTGVVL